MIDDGPCATVFPLRHARIAHVSDAVSSRRDLRAHHAREPLGQRALGARRRGSAGGGDAERQGAGAPTPVKISDEPSGTRWRFDGHAFELHPTEAEGYYLNLVAPDPKAFVMWRMTEDGGDPPVFPVIVTVSYNEAARMLDGGERVDAVPLPAGILAWMEPFVAEHYKPEPKKRVRRNDPLADGSFRRERR